MRVLVTGGFGYLGGRLAQALTTRRHTVVLGSRRLRRPPAWMPEAEVAHLDWDAPDLLRAACSRVDAVAHLAGMNVEDSAADPAAALAFNGDATARLVRAAALAGTRRLVYLSTAHVYGSPLRGTITEDTPPAATHPYATSHLVGEGAVRRAHEAGEIDGIVVRLSNAFGAPADVDVNCWMLLVNDLCRQAVQTGRMVLRSSGVQRRDFVAMSEACAMLAHLLELPPPRLGDGLFNAGGGWSPTVLEMSERLAGRVEQATGTRPEVQRPPAGPDDRTEGLCFARRKLLETGFTAAGPEVVDRELDALIRFCLHHKPQLPS